MRFSICLHSQCSSQTSQSSSNDFPLYEFGCLGFTLGLIFYYVLFAIKHSDQTLLGPSAPESRTRFTAQVIFNMSVYLGYCKCAKNDKYFPNDFCYFCLVLCLVFVLNNCIKPFISALYTVTKKSEFRID